MSSQINKVAFTVLAGLFIVSCANNQLGSATAKAFQLPVADCAGYNTCQAKLAWDPVTSMADGSPLPSVAGYKVFWGTESRHYSFEIDNGSATNAIISHLGPGTYYFAVTAYLSLQPAVESGYSNEVSKTVLNQNPLNMPERSFTIRSYPARGAPNN